MRLLGLGDSIYLTEQMIYGESMNLKVIASLSIQLKVGNGSISCGTYEDRLVSIGIYDKLA